MSKIPKKPVRVVNDEDTPVVDLAISAETVCYIIVKAREFDAKDPVTDPDEASNATDDGDLSVLEAHRDDPVIEELVSVISTLGEEEQVDLVAIAWLGRDDNTVEDWPTLREEAAEAHNRKTASYLLGMPLLADYLEEGLSLLGHDCAEMEAEHL